MQLDVSRLHTSELTTIFELFQKSGHQLYLVGGCVRDALAGKDFDDFDLATSARPTTVCQMAKTANLKCIPTGFRFGTVTLVVNGNSFEVTTFRKDLETDGRWAIVEYTDSLEEDAARRDFTINAIYADDKGSVIDPTGGLPDLRIGRVRFVGEPTDRIKEDYLRILRFFRFSAIYACPNEQLDAAALAAIRKADFDGLKRLSGFRIRKELLRLLGSKSPLRGIEAMKTCGVLECVLPGAQIDKLASLVELEKEFGAQPVALRRLALLGGTRISDRLELKKSEKAWLEQLALLAVLDEPIEVTASKSSADLAISAHLLNAVEQGKGLEPAIAELVRRRS